MNKTVNINLAGLFFHIDEEAYIKLQNYLESIKRSFTDSQGRSEIVSDIEARIAELFTERVKTSNQVIGLKEVEEVITIMGQPEDYLVDDDIFEDEPKTHYKKSSTVKKLFRDTENSYISGVSSGLAHYFGIDAIWVRLIWILLVFGFGTGFLVYILLWIFVPEAKTTTDKLHMTGEPVTISNIEKKIRDGFENVSENIKNVDFQKHGDKLKEGFDQVSDSISTSFKNAKGSSHLKNTSTNFFDTIGNIVVFIVKIFAKFIGVILMFTGISMVIGTLISLLTVGIVKSVDMPGIDFVDLSINSATPIWLLSLIIFLFVGILAFFIFYLGLKMVVPNSKSIGRTAKYALLGIWFATLIGLIYLGVRQGMSYMENAKLSRTVILDQIKSNDTLRLAMTYNDNYSDTFYRDSDFESVTNQNGQREIYSQNIRLIVKSTRDSVAKLKIEKSGNGFTYDEAKDRAENIAYNFRINKNELLLDNYFLLTNNSKPKDQRITVTLYMPVGSILFAEENTYQYHRNNSRYYNDMLDNGFEEHYLTVNKNEFICNDCPEDEEDYDDDAFEIDVNINGENGKIKINSDGLKTTNNNLEITIDSSGIKSNSENLKIDINEDALKIKSKNN
jgi:phage shock protein PspC (stress-responsive transcriptional regulator)